MAQILGRTLPVVGAGALVDRVQDGIKLRWGRLAAAIRPEVGASRPFHGIYGTTGPKAGSGCLVITKGYIQRVCTPFLSLNTQRPGATLYLLRLGTKLRRLPKLLKASKLLQRNLYKLFLLDQ